MAFEKRSGLGLLLIAVGIASVLSYLAVVYAIGDYLADLSKPAYSEVSGAGLCSKLSGASTRGTGIFGEVPATVGTIEIGPGGFTADLYRLAPASAREVLSDEGLTQGIQLDRRNSAHVKHYADTTADITKATYASDVVRSVGSYIERMRRDEPSIGCASIYVVIPRVAEYASIQVRAASRIRSDIGLQPHFLSAEEECKLSFRWLVPPARYSDSVLIDVGSGNVKVCAIQAVNGKPVFSGFELLDFGTKTLSKRLVNELTREFPEFNATTTRIGDDSPLFRQRFGFKSEGAMGQIRERLAAFVRANEELAAKKNVFLTGGATWAVASIRYPKQYAREVVEFDDVAADFGKVRAMALGEAATPPTYEATSFGDRSDEVGATNEVEQVNQTFSRVQLAVGMDLLIALSDEFSFHDKRRVAFTRETHSAWMSRYVFERVAGIPVVAHGR